MKMKTQLSLASIIVAGLLASGCSQMSSQQVAQAAPAAAKPAPVVKTIVDCSKCAKPAPRAVPKPKAGGKKKRAGGGLKKRVKRAGGGRFAHSHPAIPGCTNSITHSHPFTNAGHKHAYGCKGGKRRVVRPAAPRPAPAPRQNKWAHTHPAIPGCTDSITHSHPYNNASHTHHYSCKGGHRQQMQVPVMPKVKAKGTYRGPIQIDGGVMKQYQQ